MSWKLQTIKSLPTISFVLVRWELLLSVFQGFRPLLPWLYTSLPWILLLISTNALLDSPSIHVPQKKSALTTWLPLRSFFRFPPSSASHDAGSFCGRNFSKLVSSHSSKFSSWGEGVPLRCQLTWHWLNRCPGAPCSAPLLICYLSPRIITASSDVDISICGFPVRRNGNIAFACHRVRLIECWAGMAPAGSRLFNPE